MASSENKVEHRFQSDSQSIPVELEPNTKHLFNAVLNTIILNPRSRSQLDLLQSLFGLRRGPLSTVIKLIFFIVSGVLVQLFLLGKKYSLLIIRQR